MVRPFKICSKTRPRHEGDVIQAVLNRYHELTEQARSTSVALEAATDPVVRASAMAALAGIEEQSASLHAIVFFAGDEPTSAAVPLPTALRASAALLRFVAATEDAPAAGEFFTRLSPGFLVPGVDGDMARVVWPYLLKLAGAAAPRQRAELLSALAAELLPVVGATATETVSWLADLAAQRAATDASM